MLYLKYAQEHINMPKKEFVKNDKETYKFSTSNISNNLNKKYIKNTEQIDKNSKNIVRKFENLNKNLKIQCQHNFNYI